MKILIMAGGSGERFWPLSTKQNPKQLLQLVSQKSMIRETVDRILGLVEFSDIFVATNSIQVGGIKREIPELPDENIIIEPLFRDTAAAIAYGSTYISRFENNPVIVVLAADHLIEDVSTFQNTLLIASEEAKNGTIITLGIKPTRAETGYGYIKIEQSILGELTRSLRFMEKPDYETALKYFEDEHYVWNSGIFVFRYNTIMNELQQFVPKHISIIGSMSVFIEKYSGIELSSKTKPFFEKFERISIDFAVMEKSRLIRCIPVDIGWNDVGGYNALFDILDKDESYNAVKDARYIQVDSQNNIVITEQKGKLVTSIGVHNMIIVDSQNGLLVCNRDDSQRIKELLKLL